MKEGTDYLGQQLTIENRFPVEWEMLDSSSPSLHASWSARNEKVLKQIIELDEHTRELAESSTHGQETSRLENKLNLLIELTGSLIESQMPFPEKRAVRISSQGIEWSCDHDTEIEKHALVLNRIYMHPYAPWPVEFVGEVQEIKDTPEGKYCIMSFHYLTENEQELLEKLIFRHHRRTIASKKS